MTAVAPARPAMIRPGAVTVRRLLRLELRRNAAIAILPLLAVAFWLDTYRMSMASFPVWGLRGAILADRVVSDFATFGAGVGAWMGSREGRRGAADLVGVTARPGWLRQSITLAATTCWMMTAYACCVAVLYGVTAGEGAWGSPEWWPVALGAAGVVAACTAGFAAGAFWPSRFTAPFVAVGVEVLILIGTSLDSSPYARLTPGAANLNNDIGAFYPYLPDQVIDQVIFLGGITIAIAGLLGLAAGGGGRLLRGTAAVITAAGLIAAGTAAGLAGGARQGPEGVIIPGLHDAADDRPIPYSPACAAYPVPICVNPAFRAYLPDLDGTLGSAFSEVAGLPGAPVRADQISDLAGDPAGDGLLSGTPSVYRFALQSLGPHGIPGLQENFLIAFIDGKASNWGTTTQQAAWLGLLNAVGDHIDESVFSPAVVAAAARFAAQLPAARHAWLAAHLTALRAGHITVGQLP
jgi:hypothetical protein